MNDIYKAVIRTKTSYLVHYNHNHDKLGRFAKSNGASSDSGFSHQPDGRFAPPDRESEKYKKDQETYKQERDEAWKDRKTNPEGFREKMAKAQNKLGETYKKLKESQEQKAKEYADYVSGVDGDSAKSDKDIIPYEQVSSFLKNQKLSAIRGKIYIDHGTNLKTGKEDFNVVGQSTSKVWKEEVKTKNGVHIIQTHPTDIDFGDVAHDSGKGIDRNKLKTLDSFSVSKDSNKAVYSGKDFIVDKKWDSMEYDAVTSGGGKKDLGSKKSNARNFNPSYISYGFDKNGKPKVKSIEYKPTYSTYGFDSTSEITVLFDDKGKPYKILEDE